MNSNILKLLSAIYVLIYLGAYIIYLCFLGYNAWLLYTNGLLFTNWMAISYIGVSIYAFFSGLLGSIVSIVLGIVYIFLNFFIGNPFLSPIFPTLNIIFVIATILFTIAFTIQES